MKKSYTNWSKFSNLVAYHSKKPSPIFTFCFVLKANTYQKITLITILLLTGMWSCNKWENPIANIEEHSFLQLDNLTIVGLIVGGGLLVAGLVFMLLLQQRKQQRLQARMNTLQAQINPHFFSNSLNAIESLINLDQSKAASKYLIHFSRFTRRILNSSMDTNTTLAGELLTTKHFLTLEQLRFKDKLYFDIECADEVKPDLVEIPSLIFQPYLENAIWHGIKPKINPSLLQVKITKEGKKLVCVIQDDGIGRAEAEIRKEKTLLQRKSKNMKISGKRLSRFGGDPVEVVDLKNKNGTARGTKVILRLPYKTV